MSGDTCSAIHSTNKAKCNIGRHAFNKVLHAFGQCCINCSLGFDCFIHIIRLKKTHPKVRGRLQRSREDKNQSFCSAFILSNSTFGNSLFCHRIFSRKIRPQIRARVDLLEGRVHDRQQMQAREVAGKVFQLVLLGRVVDLKPIAAQ